MKQKRHTDEQILIKLRRAEGLLAEGKTVAEMVKEIEVTQVTYYRWKKQFGGVEKDELRRLKKLEKENELLKKLVAEKELDITMLKAVVEGKY